MAIKIRCLWMRTVVRRSTRLTREAQNTGLAIATPSVPMTLNGSTASPTLRTGYRFLAMPTLVLASMDPAATNLTFGRQINRAKRLPLIRALSTSKRNAVAFLVATTLLAIGQLRYIIGLDVLLLHDYIIK